MSTSNWAIAKMVRWDLQNVSFRDGQSIIGWFDYDATTNQIGDYSINAGIDFPVLPSECIEPDACYSMARSGELYTGETGFSFTSYVCPSASCGTDINLVPTTPLTDSGGSVPLVFGTSDIHGQPLGSHLIHHGLLLEVKLIATGMLVKEIPEPHLSLMLLIGIAAVIALSRARHRCRLGA
jgi:hypothetical protein